MNAINETELTYTAIAERVEAFLKDKQWQYKREDGKECVLIRSGIGGLGGVVDNFVFVLVIRDDEIQNYASLPFSAKERVPECCEFVARANYSMKYGAFEVNCETGEIRFHMIYPFEALVANVNKAMERMLMIPVAMVSRYATGLSQVITGDKLPTDAIVSEVANVGRS